MTTLFPNRHWFIAAAAILMSAAAHAQATTIEAATEEVSVFSNTLFNTLLAVSVLLLIVIVGLAQMLQGAARYHLAKEKVASPEKKESSSSNTGTVAGIALVAGLLLPVITSAQAVAAAAGDAATEAVREVPNFPDTIGGLSVGVFFLMLGVIFVEILVAYMLWHSGMRLLKTEEAVAKRKARKAAPAFIENLNASVAIEEEGTIMLDHEYDGIRELDNNLPPWWKYGFYLTIVFAVVYLIHFHVSKTGPLQLEEYKIKMEEGERQKAEYRKNAANLVDENSVFQLKSADSIALGQAIFKEKCAVCHGQQGQGDIGPNFTDNYWLHGGDIKSVFTTVKYGVTSKGMQAWEKDLSPIQIQQVSSYILSLAGTNVAGGKAAEGTIFNPNGAVSDSTATPVNDSLKKADTTIKATQTTK